jgi:FkbM family methyltransferase
VTDVSACPDGERRCRAAFGGLTFEITLDARFDDPVAQAFAEGGVWMPHLCDLMLALVKPGDAVLDLGAHLGAMALPAAAAGCRVLAVEASGRNAELLGRSAARNGFARMRVVHAAAGAAAGTADFSPHGPWGHVYTEATKMPSVPTRVVAVDDLLEEAGWPRVDFVKMDIEGSEIAALRGMKKLLSRDDAPVLLYESNSCGLKYYGHTVEQLKAEVQRFGYTNHLVQPDRLLRPVRARDVQPESTVDYLAWKRQPAGLGGWRVGPPLSRRERIDRIVNGLDATDPNEIAHLSDLLGASWLTRARRARRMAARLVLHTHANFAWLGRLWRQSA